MQSAQEKNPLRRAHYFFGTTRSFTERGTDQLIAQLQKHYESFYCPKNMHLVIVSPLPLQRMEDSAKNSFGSLDRECSASRGSEKEEPHVSPLQLEVSPGAEPGAGMGGSLAEGRCPAATEPAASQVGRYRAPFAVLQEASWGEAFPKENLGRQFLAKAPARPEITILFPLPIFELYRKADFYGVISYLAYVFGDSGHKSLRTVLRKESLIEGLFLNLESLTSKAGSFLLVDLMLTDEADENPERRALLWRTLFRWFQQLQAQTTDDLLGFLGPIKQLQDVLFTWTGRDAVSLPTDLAISLTRNEPVEVVRGESVISDMSACLLRAILESLTASNMNYAYFTNHAENRLPSENSRIMPHYHFNYTESPIPASVMQAASVDHTRTQEVGLPAPESQNPTTGETAATALSIALPKPIDKDNIPSVKQHLHDVVDQMEIPIAVLGSDLYFYAPQPKTEQPTVKINFHLKDVDDSDPAPAAFGSRPGSASSSCGRDISLRCRMLGKIRTRIVSRLLDPLLNVFYKVGNDYSFAASGSGMAFEFEAFPDQIEELMRIVVGVALDPITGSGSSGSALAESTNVRKIFRQEVKRMQAQLEDIGMDTADGHAYRYQDIILQKKVFSREEKLRWLKQYTTRSGTQDRETDQRQEEIVRSDAIFAGTNLDALWTELEGYLSEEAEGRRRFRMTSLAAGNLDLETAQRYERTMRELLTATNRTTSASSTSSARGLSLVDPGTTMGASKLALQNRVLRLESDTPKQIEMRVANPMPKDKSQHATRMTLQFGTAETAEEEALLLLVGAMVNRESGRFMRKKTLEYTSGGDFWRLASVWHYTVYAAGDSMNPDQIIPLVYENNLRIREMLGNLTTTEILHSARTLLKNLREPYTTVDALFDHAREELREGGACFQRRRAMAEYLDTTLLRKLKDERKILELFDDHAKDYGLIDKNFGRKEFKAILDARFFPEPDPDDDEEEGTQRGISVAKEEVEDAGGFKGHASKRAPAGGRLADIEEDAEEEQGEADSSDASSRGDNHQAGPISGIQAQLVAIFDRFLNGPALTIKLFNSTSHHLIAQDPPTVILPGNKLAKPLGADAGTSPCSAAVPKQQGPDDLHEVAKMAKGIATAMQTPKPDVLKCGPDGVCVLRKVPDFEEKTNMLTLRNFDYWERSKMCAALAGVR